MAVMQRSQILLVEKNLKCMFCGLYVTTDPDERVSEVRTETIKVGRLADFVSAKEIAGPAPLKLDVQGFELEALQRLQRATGAVFPSVCGMGLM